MAEVTLLDPAPAPGRSFGAALSARGDALLVGCPCRDYAAGAAEGAAPPEAALFVRRGGEWSLAQRLPSRDPIRAEGFGRAVLLGDGFALVGAPGQDNGDGPVEWFARDAGGALRSRGLLDAPGEGLFADPLIEFGVALAGDARLFLVGAPLDATEIDGAGIVYGYDPASAVPGPPMEIAFGPGMHANLGAATALSGDRLVIGAPSTYGRSAPGLALLLERDAARRWQRRARLDGGQPSDAFGAAVAIDGDRIAIGAPGTPPGRGPAGRVHVYEITGSGVRQIAFLEGEPGFGNAVAINGNRIAIGASMAPNAGIEQAGRVDLYRIATDIRIEERISAPTATRFARFGEALAIGPDYIAIGAPGRGDGTGRVLVRASRRASARTGSVAT